MSHFACAIAWSATRIEEVRGRTLTNLWLDETSPETRSIEAYYRR